MTELAEIIGGVTTGALGRRAVAERLRALADRLDPQDLVLTHSNEAAPPGPRGPSKAHREAWQTLWAYWVQATGKVRAKPTPERRKVVLARLRDGYTPDQIKRAIDGCLQSEHHVDGGHIDLTLICRNGAKLEAFVERAGAGPAFETPVDETVDDGALAKLKAAMVEALRAGQTGRYRALERAFRERQGTVR